MKRTIAPETVVVNFKPYAEVDLTPERLYRLQYYLDEGYKSEDYGSYTRVFRKPYIEFCVDGIVVANATHKLFPWYGVKNATEQLAEQVASELASGILEMFYDGDDLQKIDFERHSLQKAAV